MSRFFITANEALDAAQQSAFARVDGVLKSGVLIAGSTWRTPPDGPAYRVRAISDDEWEVVELSELEADVLERKELQSKLTLITEVELPTARRRLERAMTDLIGIEARLGRVVKRISELTLRLFRAAQIG